MLRKLLLFSSLLLVSAGCDKFSPPAIPPTSSGPAPETTVTGGPRTPTRLTTASFQLGATVSGTDTEATFQCSLDNAAFAPCASPASFATLSAGAHSFRAYAILSDGRFDATPATHSWTVNTTPLETTITSAPPAVTSSTSVTIAFAASEASATFECALNGADFSVCTSPATFADLAAGDQTFLVRAVDADGTKDASPAQARFRVDTAGLTVSFTAAPSATVTDSFATFAFQANAEGVSFLCGLDGGAFVSCSSPYTIRNLQPGTHQLSVAAEDSTGNRSVPATAAFTVKWNNGTACGAGTDCLSGFCADGLCCNEACTGSCRSCTVNRGSCTVVRNAVDADTCSGENQCDDNGVCGPSSDTLSDGFEFSSGTYRFRGNFPSGKFQFESPQYKFQGRIEATR